MNRATAVALAFIVTTATLSVAAVGAGASAASPSQQTVGAQSDSDAYAGAYVAFEASGNALTDYRVDDDPVFENVSVAAQSDHQTEAGVGADVSLAAVTNLSGAGLEFDARSETRAEVSTEGSASINAHDTERGILTVDAGDEAQYVELELAGESEAEADGDRVVVESDERTGAFVVVGDGDVTVNEQGDVTADLESESTLVFRSYADGERDDDAEAQEELIADGTATAEVYVDERDGDRVADVATYGQGVAVETQSQSEDRLEMTVERARSEGTVVITSVSESALEAAESADDLEVTVDGEAAAEASSYSELEGGIGEEPRYMVSQSGEASAAADVLVAVDHFSEREVAIQDSGSDETGDDTADSVPGFGAIAALVAALVAAASRVR
ncbi:putative sodium/potassium/calcium exchanger [Natronococcus wangiae]|uniref:hypothetical protein n=1 Tax=Natronococcus wangiae TaxID=3068275 RepID=UPI00273EA02F|nr:hypothetical protein [Natronococcus sp. AD5]